MEAGQKKSMVLYGFLKRKFWGLHNFTGKGKESWHNMKTISSLEHEQFKAVKVSGWLNQATPPVAQI